MKPESVAVSILMLREVLNGDTYDDVAKRHGYTRTSVERRIKNVMRVLFREVGIEGMTADSIGFVQRIRQCRQQIAKAIEKLDPVSPVARSSRSPILSTNDIDRAVRRTRVYSSVPLRDIALLYILFSTGARPLEIARLEIADYLNKDGSVRVQSVIRAEIALNSKPRPLYFASTNTVKAIDAYLADRALRAGHRNPGLPYRGFLPNSSLLLNDSYEPFEIQQTELPDQNRYLCRDILYVCRKVFRRLDIKGLSALDARRTVAARMRAQGANDEQIGEILGIANLNRVRGMLPSLLQPLHVVMRDLV